jgi:hypothetical protein
MNKEQILESMGEPEEIEKTPFGRETWVFPPTLLQITYSNEGAPGWYLFLSHEEPPARLILQFDSTGTLQSLLPRLPTEEAQNLVKDCLEK